MNLNVLDNLYFWSAARWLSQPQINDFNADTLTHKQQVCSFYFSNY